MNEQQRAITKAVFLNAVVCHRLGWYLLNREGEPAGEGALLRMREGQEVGEKARSIFPDGIFAGSTARTAELMEQPEVQVIFEAAFVCDGYAARADILRRVGDGFSVIEVKSSLHVANVVKPELLDDLAYTVMVLSRAGVNVVGAELLLLSRDWRLGMEDRQLFVPTPCTEGAKGRAAEFSERWDAVRDAVLAQTPPTAEAIFACRSCDFFESDCIGVGVEAPVFGLPRLSEKRFTELDGVLSILDIPSDFPLTPPQDRVRLATVGGQPVVDRDVLRSLLGEVRWPAGYLDFETVKMAVPIWPGVRPHEQVVTQYSLHVVNQPGGGIEHVEFLADATRDCRRELAERLLEHTAGIESIVVYSNFEKGVLTGLGERFPDLAAPLAALCQRLFDLERVFRDGYCHPAFRGSTSIKRTLPVMVPGMSYDGLVVGNGDAAIAAFARMARGECGGDAVVPLRQALLDYCKQDTLAMVRLHEALIRRLDA